jgi:hypothetical protein
MNNELFHQSSRPHFFNHTKCGSTLVGEGEDERCNFLVRVDADIRMLIVSWESEKPFSGG